MDVAGRFHGGRFSQGNSEREACRGCFVVTLVLVAPSSQAELIALGREADGILLSSREPMSSATFAAPPDAASSAAMPSASTTSTSTPPPSAAARHRRHPLPRLLHVRGCRPRARLDLGPQPPDRSARPRSAISGQARGATAPTTWTSSSVDRSRPCALTIGIVDFGRIGRAVVARLAPLGCRVIVSGPFVDGSLIRQADAEPIDQPAMLAPSSTPSRSPPIRRCGRSRT